MHLDVWGGSRWSVQVWYMHSKTDSIGWVVSTLRITVTQAQYEIEFGVTGSKDV